MMKKRTYYLMAVSALALAGQLNSCNDWLEPEALSDLTKEDIISKYGNTEETLNALYAFLPNGFACIGDEWQNDAAMLAGASDEAEYTIETNDIHKFNTGSWNAIENPDPAWKHNFEAISAVNQFLVNIHSVNMDNLIYSLSATDHDTYRKNLIRMERWKYEARFLRAFFYSELVKRYGGLPIMDQPVTVTDNYTDIPRSPLSDCIRFITSECDSCAAHLPGNYMSGDLGRITKGAALALKSRVLLYAASDLFNDPSWANGYGSPELISMTDNKTREERWQDAAEAAAAVITLKTDSVQDWYPEFRSYSLVINYADLFRPTNPETDPDMPTKMTPFDNPEVILVRRMDYINSFEKINYPIGYNGGNSGITPSGNMVDAYYYMRGSAISAFDWNNPEHAEDPFNNVKRDRRLQATILLNNMEFKGSPVQAWRGGLDGKGVLKASKTGYYLKKYVDPDLDLVLDQRSAHAWIIIRFAEIYLNYAEAMNEIAGPDGKIDGAPTAREAVNMIRSRARMPTVSRTVTQSELKEIVRYERRIELAFEDHRLWDTRRWMIAEQELGKPLTGVEVDVLTEDPIIVEETDDEGNVHLVHARDSRGSLRYERTFQYRPVVVENRIFRREMYFYPVPQKELSIARGWVQNPGW
jgi:hypothetical protein